MERCTRYRFNKDNRLLDAAAFDRVFDKASRSRDKWFTVLSRPNKMNTARLGLAISKKHCKKASRRNQLKRIVRESFRTHQAELRGFDIVVMNKPACVDARDSALVESLTSHWQQCQKNSGNNKKRGD